jgi:hypothetical protein
MSDNYLKVVAARIPEGIRKHLLEEKLIERAINISDLNTPMEYIFDVYEEFIDTAGEHDDWNCHKCREHVIQDMRKLKPFLEELQNAN